MLQTIHDKLKGWLAGVVLGAIGLVFIFWGINWTMTAPNYAAKVNGVEISSNDVRQAYQQQLAQYERQANGQLSDAERTDLKRRVLEEYVNSEALVTREDNLGYRVSDQQLLTEMSHIPQLQVDGKWDLAHALAVLKAQGRPIGQIEDMLRHDAKLRQLDTAISASSFVTPAELARLRALTQQQREIAWLTIPAAKLATEATPDDAAVKTYYDAHKAQYMTPETVNLRYVEVSLADLAAKVHVDDAELKTYYDEQKTKTPERFTQPEQRRIRHILFQVSSDPKDDAVAKAKAEAALKRAQSGEDFGKLAQELSQDTGSAKSGGDLGWAERSRYVGPFADAAFSMKEGDIKGPVKTQFGYHILKLDGIQPVAVKTFEQSKSDLDAEYRRTEAERLFNDAQDSLADAALQNADIDVVARKAGLEVHEIANFSRSGGGDLGKAPAVVEAAFSPDVIDGHLSPMVEIEKGRGVVLRATEHQLPKQKPLEDVRAEVVAAWKTERGAELATQQAAAAVKRLQGGEAWDSVAKSLGLAPQPPKFVARTDKAVPAEVLQGAFDETKPAGNPIYSSAPLPDGDAAVIALSAVREEPAGADSKAQEAMLKGQLSRQAAAAEAREYAVAARADAKVSENLQALD